MKSSLFTYCIAAVGFTLPSSWAEAKELRYKDIPLEIKPGEQISISALKGSVRLVSVEPGQSTILRVRKSMADKSSADSNAKFEALSFSAKREGSQLSIAATGPESKQAWSEWLKASGPDLHIELHAPSVATEVSLREGLVVAQNWKQPLAVSVVEGKVKTSSTEAAIQIQLQRGEIQVDGHKGSLSVDSYAAKVTAENLEGRTQLTNFGGETRLSQVDGAIELRVHGGGTSIRKAKGSLDFLLGRGGLTVQSFEGPIRGETDRGSVSLHPEGETEVAVKSVQGTVTVTAPDESGASIRLQSEEGLIAAPEAFRPVTNAAGLKQANGRLPGSGPKGNIFVQSKSGTIRLRQ